VLDPLTGPGLDTLSLAPATTQQHAAQVRQARQHLDDLTAHPDAVDFDAARLSDASGATVSAWVDSRQGLSATATGTPEMHRAAPEIGGWPAVEYAATGERHVGTAIDWSAYNVATLITVWYSDVSGSNAGIASLHANLSAVPAISGDIEHLLGMSSGYWTPLHRPDGAGNFFLERDQIDDTGAPQATVSVHDTAAKALADEIRGYQNGVEITGSTTGVSGGGANWRSVIYPVIGERGDDAGEGLDGRVARFIALPVAIDGLAASRVLLLAYGLT